MWFPLLRALLGVTSLLIQTCTAIAAADTQCQCPNLSTTSNSVNSITIPILPPSTLTPSQLRHNRNLFALGQYGEHRDETGRRDYHNFWWTISDEYREVYNEAVSSRESDTENNFKDSDTVTDSHPPPLRRLIGSPPSNWLNPDPFTA